MRCALSASSANSWSKVFIVDPAYRLHGFADVAVLPATWHPDATMRLPNAVHESGPWRIREIVPDFTLEDVWALPAHGGAEDFPTLLELATSLDPANADSLPARALWRDPRPPRRVVRPRPDLRTGRRQGALPIPGTEQRSLAERLPDDLRNSPWDHDFGSLPFQTAVPHRHRGGGGDLEQDRARRDAPGLGRLCRRGWGRRPLPGPDGRLRQAARPRSARPTWPSSSRSGT